VKQSASHTVAEHAQVLIAGGRPNDIPGVKLRPIREIGRANMIVIQLKEDLKDFLIMEK